MNPITILARCGSEWIFELNHNLVLYPWTLQVPNGLLAMDREDFKNKGKEGKSMKARERKMTEKEEEEEREGRWEPAWTRKQGDGGFPWLTLVSLQVLICGNFRGSTIKSGSMGKASPPYDVQVGSLCDSALSNLCSGGCRVTFWVTWLYKGCSDTILWPLC